MSETLFSFILGVVTAFILMGYFSYVEKIRWQEEPMKKEEHKEEHNIECVDRFEVIDENGRVYAKGPMYDSPVDVELSYQDEGKTLKVFITDKIEIKERV